MTTPAPARSSFICEQLLSDRSAQAQSSAIRDLLDHAKRPGMISLAGGLPAATLFPVEELAALAASVLRQDGQSVLQYGTTQGLPAARTGLASLFGDHVAPEHLIVTTGSQQALDLIARVVVNPGDQIVAGDPDYLGALQVFRSYGADVRPIAIDADGLDTEQLEEELRWGLRPKCCYIVPHFHNPTGVTMSAERRAHLHELSATYGFLVIEDDPYRELYYGGDAPTEATGDPELTVQLRSTSKVLAPGLRVGSLAPPSWLVDPLIVAKQSCDLHTSSLTQLIAAQAIAAPWYADHVEQLRGAYRRKRDALVASLQAAFGESVDLAVPQGGMFVWAKFPGIDDTTDWLRDCLKGGVCFVPGPAFAVSRDLSKHARFSFATASCAELTEAVARLLATVPGAKQAKSVF